MLVTSCPKKKQNLANEKFGVIFKNLHQPPPFALALRGNGDWGEFLPVRAWRGNACNWHQKRRKPWLALSHLPSFWIWTTCLLRSMSWEGDGGSDLGLSGLGLSYGSLCEDCVCLSGGMTPKYNTRRAFVSLLPLLSSGGEGKAGGWVQFDSDYSGGDGVFFF